MELESEMYRAKSETTKKETEPPSKGAPAPTGQGGWKFNDWAAI